MYDKLATNGSDIRSKRCAMLILFQASHEFPKTAAILGKLAFALCFPSVCRLEITASAARTQLLPLVQPASFCYFNDCQCDRTSFSQECAGFFGTSLCGHRGRLGRLADPNDPARHATKDPPSAQGNRLPAAETTEHYSLPDCPKLLQ